MPFEQQVSTWAMNGLKNPNWENLLKAGLLNLSSIGVGNFGPKGGNGIARFGAQMQALDLLGRVPGDLN